MIKQLVVCCVVFVFSLGTAHAAITVGTCTSVRNPYLTISSAIAASPANGTIDVCPGTYREQLIITKPLSIFGMVIPGQTGVKIMAPVTGLAPDPSYVKGKFYTSYDGYSQVNFQSILAIHAGGAVNLSNLAIVGGPLVNIWSQGQMDLKTACQSYVADVAGIMYRNTPGTITNVSVTHVFGQFSPYKVGSLTLTAGCGTGIHIKNDSGIAMTFIRKSVVNDGDQGGWTGIRADGPTNIDHNIITVTGSGAYGVDGSSDDAAYTPLIVTNNTVNGSNESTGIYGQGNFSGNTVIRSGVGIVQNYGTGTTSTVTHNTLINNSVGIIGGEQIADNLIYASSPTYQEVCEATTGGHTSCATPTIGIQLICSSPRSVGANSVVGTGIGIEGFSKGTTPPASNLFADVDTSTMGCYE